MTNTQNRLKKLLKEIGGIAERHNERMRKEGYMFNLFAITKIERKEVNTHSAMIAELLNPKGRHGQGDIFLKAFLKVIDRHLVNHSAVSEKFLMHELNTKAATIKKEKSFNKGSDRIDILIEFENFLMIIENKIDALDGKNQLERYNKVGKYSGKKYCLLYLTKFGSAAEEYSHKGVTYEIISYEEHITTWLEECIKEVEHIPMVREGIFQYLNLVKKITGIGMSSELNKDIIKLLLEDEKNIAYASKLASQINAAKGSILHDFFGELTAEIEKCGYKTVSNFNKRDLKRIYNMGKCQKWFEGGKGKTCSIGVFFDIGFPNHLFHVEVATKVLHYGIVNVHNNDVFSITSDEIKAEKTWEDKGWKPRNWKLIKWYSCEYKYVFSDITVLRNPDDFIRELKEAIEFTTQYLTSKR